MKEMEESCVAIIPARGGSKRIPRKNIRDFCGKPIIAYSIEAAMNAGIFDEVMISTDDEEIAEIAQKYGASVPFMRSKETSDDLATTDDVLIEVLKRYCEEGKTYRYFSCIYATAPFVTSSRLVEAFEIIRKNKALALMAVAAYSFPPQRAMIRNEINGNLKYIYPEDYEKRSQDLVKWYHDAGQFYFYESENFIRCKGRIIDKIYPMILSGMEVQDIDNEMDWEIAELKYRLTANARVGKSVRRE